MAGKVLPRICKFPLYTKDEAVRLICYALDNGFEKFKKLLRKKDSPAKPLLAYFLRIVGKETIFDQEDFSLSLIVALMRSGSEHKFMVEMRKIFHPQFAEVCRKKTPDVARRYFNSTTPADKTEEIGTFNSKLRERKKKFDRTVDLYYKRTRSLLVPKT